MYIKITQEIVNNQQLTPLDKEKTYEDQTQILVWFDRYV